MSALNWVRQHRVGLSLGGGFIGLHAAAYGFFAAHNPYRETIFPPCLLLHYVGIQCPGCGGTRAMYSLMHGDVAASLAMNPIVIAGYVALALLLAGVVSERTAKAKISRGLYGAAGAVAVVATVWSAIIRNLIA